MPEEAEDAPVHSVLLHTEQHLNTKSSVCNFGACHGTACCGLSGLCLRHQAGGGCAARHLSLCA